MTRRHIHVYTLSSPGCLKHHRTRTSALQVIGTPSVDECRKIANPTLQKALLQLKASAPSSVVTL